MFHLHNGFFPTITIYINILICLRGGRTHRKHKDNQSMVAIYVNMNSRYCAIMKIVDPNGSVRIYVIPRVWSVHNIILRFVLILNVQLSIQQSRHHNACY